MKRRHPTYSFQVRSILTLGRILTKEDALTANKHVRRRSVLYVTRELKIDTTVIHVITRRYLLISILMGMLVLTRL